MTSRKYTFFDQWCHLGSVKDHQELDELPARPCFDRDTYRYLLKFLNQKNVEIIPLHENTQPTYA